MKSRSCSGLLDGLLRANELISAENSKRDLLLFMLYKQGFKAGIAEPLRLGNSGSGKS
jgi:hypothetical protein